MCCKAATWWESYVGFNKQENRAEVEVIEVTTRETAEQSSRHTKEKNTLFLSEV